jgi:hypothetical protein
MFFLSLFFSTIPFHIGLDFKSFFESPKIFFTRLFASAKSVVSFKVVRAITPIIATPAPNQNAIR